MVSATATTMKKTSSAATAKKPRSHPPYAEMITEAIKALKKKLLLVQLKKLVASGKITKVKGSFKVSPVIKPTTTTSTKTTAAKPKKKTTTTAAATGSAKAKIAAPKKKKATMLEPRDSMGA
ncbi:hypothetical protein BC332_24015 [Capsicum chinense]|nr:hypothetical protein BC332_24015 [Capsicum chinense]